MLRPQFITLLNQRAFSKLRGDLVYSSDGEQDGKDKSVKSSFLIGSLMPRGLKEAQGDVDFTLKALTQQKQRPHNGLP
ncbi:hypothetical protein Tco_1580543, partial [Tanacetum coccineum]